MRQFLGDASSVYGSWRQDLLHAIAVVEAGIDFSEDEDIASSSKMRVLPALESLVNALEEALAMSSRASAIRSGVRLVICGPPNAGKSTLMNILAAGM